MADHMLDLRGIACPMNFVKTKLFLDKLAAGETLQVLVDGGEPVDSLCSSLEAEGHQLLSRTDSQQGHFSVDIRKV